MAIEAKSPLVGGPFKQNKTNMTSRPCLLPESFGKTTKKEQLSSPSLRQRHAARRQLGDGLESGCPKLPKQRAHLQVAKLGLNISWAGGSADSLADWLDPFHLHATWLV